MKDFKAYIKITLRKEILDVQGKAVEHGLHSIDFNQLTNIRIGRYAELDVKAEDAEKAKRVVSEACKKLIANPIIEDFEIEIKEKK